MTLLVRFLSAFLRRLLALFPEAYRREYGEEHAWVLRRVLADKAAQGWLPLLQWCARELRDLPVALLREHGREWRQKMNDRKQTTLWTEKGLTGWRLLWFLLPFLVVVLQPVSGMLPGNPWVPIIPLFVVTIVVAVAGFSKGLPYWALPSLGLGLGAANLLLFQRISQISGRALVLSRLKAALWTGVMVERALYALIAESFFLLPTVLLLLLFGLLAAALPGHFAFGRRLRQDWTLLPFVFYISNLPTPLIAADPYRGLDLYQLLYILLLAAGTWFYLRAARPAVRMATLLTVTLVCGLVLALGIYLIYPHQSWAGAGAGFPRWWETLVPLLATADQLIALCLLALVAFVFPRRRQLITAAA